nr:hypothetical protein [Mucilaginibacter sp. X5P1]
MLSLKTAQELFIQIVLDTDPYGQPAFIYTHKDGVEGIAKDPINCTKKPLRSI